MRGFENEPCTTKSLFTVLKLFLIGIEPGSTATTSNLTANKYGSLLSTVIAEAINEWGIEVLAEIDVIAESENIALFRRPDGYESVTRRVARDFNLPYVYCDPLPQITVEDLDRSIVNDLKNEELKWIEKLESLNQESFLFVLSRAQLEVLVKLAEKNGVSFRDAMTKFCRGEANPASVSLQLSVMTN